jgi:hypothetical protein
MVAVSEEEEERCGTTGRDRAMVAMVRMDMALHGVAVVLRSVEGQHRHTREQDATRIDSGGNPRVKTKTTQAGTK